MLYNSLFCIRYRVLDNTNAIFSAFVVNLHPIVHKKVKQLLLYDHFWLITNSGDVRKKFSIIIGPALEQLCCQRTHMLCEYIILHLSKGFINREIYIVC